MKPIFRAPPRTTPLTLLPRCDPCGLHRSALHPKLPVQGKGKLGVLIVTDSPDHDSPRHLTGVPRNFLTRTLHDLGVSLDDDCWLTSALICPGGNDAKAPHCLPNVLGSIRTLKPVSVLLLGSVAVKSVLGALWGEKCGGIARWEGWRIPSQAINSWVIPTYHPAMIRWTKSPEVATLRFNGQVKSAFGATRPWPEVPKDDIRFLYDGETASRAIREMIRSPVPVAFDYETNCLKPDSERARLFCCSLSDGKRSIVFPVGSGTEEALREFLTSPVPKVGANAKFEIRWSRAKLGVDVRGVVHDTVVEGHLLDSRPGVAGVKFQAFVRLGRPPYADEAERFLKGKKNGGNAINRIRDMDTESLYRYCGIDSLVEWQIAQSQRQEVGKPGWGN